MKRLRGLLFVAGLAAVCACQLANAQPIGPREATAAEVAARTGQGYVSSRRLPTSGGVPGGSGGQIQFNNSGAFGGFTLSGDATLNTGTGALTLSTVNANVGTFGSATASPSVTVNAKGLVTAGSNVTITPALSSITGLGANVGAALAVNVGTAGAPVINGGALGTPSSGNGSNLTALTAANISAGALASGMTATTQTASDNSTKIATTAYVDTATSGPHSITFVIDGAGIPLTTAAGKMVPVLFGGTLKKYKIVCQPSGSITCDILRSANGAGVPSVSIVGAGTKPVVSASTEGSIISSFASYTSTTITAGDNFILSPTTVDGVVTYVCLTLYYQ
jgi:hypothetical protein